jgi:hypothetical protein
VSVSVTPHAIQRYIERAFNTSPDAAAKLIMNCVLMAKGRKKRGRDMLIRRVRILDGRGVEHFYLKFVTPQRKRVYLAVDARLSIVYTVLTLEMFKDLIGSPRPRTAKRRDDAELSDD